MPFRVKLQTLLVLLVGISCGLLLWLSLRKANHLAFELIQEKVLSVAVSAAPRVDGNLVQELVSPEQDGSEAYNQIRDYLREVRDANNTGALPIRFIYIMRPLPSGDWEYVVDAEEDGEDKSYLGDVVEFHFEREKPDLNSARVDEQYAKDSFGTWLSAFAPVLDSNGEPVAVLGVDIKASRIQELLGNLLVGDLIAMLIALGLASALAAWLSRKVTRPLTELRDFVRSVGAGDFTSRLKVSSNDEFGELARAVNQMADGLEERESLKGALVHYVRSQAADRKVGGDSSEEMEESRVTVLVAELCGFSQLSSMLGSERVFALLNEYFSTMIDTVLRHRGSLEKSADESVIAVFGSENEDQHQERHAIEAALAMQHALAKLIRSWKIQTNQPIYLGIGIHSGTVFRRDGRLDFDAVHELEKVAGEMKKAVANERRQLVVSDQTAENLHHVFPLNAVEEDTLEFAVFEVDMPQPAFR